MGAMIINGTSGNDRTAVDSNNQYTVNALAEDGLIKISLTTNFGGRYFENFNNHYGGDGADIVDVHGGSAHAIFRPFKREFHTFLVI